MVHIFTAGEQIAQPKPAAWQYDTRLYPCPLYITPKPPIRKQSEDE